MASYIYCAPDICIIILSLAILLEHSLTHSLLKVVREEVEQEVESLVVATTVWHIEDVEVKHPLQHIVQEVVFIVVAMEARTNGELGTGCVILYADKSHQIAGGYGVADNGANSRLAELLALVAQAMRKNKQVWMFFA